MNSSHTAAPADPLPWTPMPLIAPPAFRPWIVRCRDDAHAAGEAARVVLDARVRSPGPTFALALSGGRSGARFCAELLRQAAARGMRLDDVDFFWADERCVPANHEESNYRLAHAALLRPLAVAEARQHRLAGEAPPVEAARRANADWARWLAARGPGQPGLDVVVLGVGEDGHIASLFPGNLAADLAAPEPFRAVTGPKPPPQRLTMGFSLLAKARLAVVLATGTGKAEMVAGSLRGTLDTPLARLLALRATQGETVIVCGQQG